MIDSSGLLVISCHRRIMTIAIWLKNPRRLIGQKCVCRSFGIKSNPILEILVVVCASLACDWFRLRLFIPCSVRAQQLPCTSRAFSSFCDRSPGWNTFLLFTFWLHNRKNTHAKCTWSRSRSLITSHLLDFTFRLISSAVRQSIIAAVSLALFVSLSGAHDDYTIKPHQTESLKWLNRFGVSNNIPKCFSLLINK